MHTCCCDYYRSAFERWVLSDLPPDHPGPPEVHALRSQHQPGTRSTARRR